VLDYLQCWHKERPEVVVDILAEVEAGDHLEGRRGQPLNWMQQPGRFVVVAAGVYSGSLEVFEE